MIVDIDIDSLNSKSGLTRTIKALKLREKRIRKQMTILGRKMRYDPDAALIGAHMDSWVKYNEELRKVKIWEAELTCKKNLI